MPRLSATWWNANKSTRIKANPLFTAKYNELDRAYKAIKDDEALHARELLALQKLGQQVAALA